MSRFWAGIVLLVLGVGVVLWWLWPSQHDTGRYLVGVARDTVGWVGGDEAILFDLVALKVYDHMLYAADLGDLSIKKFSLDGKLLARYGGRRGEGPGELQHLVDFSLHQSDLWIADVRRRMLLHFDARTGRYLGGFAVPEIHPLRIAQVGPYLFVLGLGPFEELFVQYDTSGRFRRRFGLLTDQQNRKKIGMYGHLANLGDTALLFVPKMAGYAFLFDTAGTLQARMPLLDARPFPMPRLEERPEGRLYVAPRSDTLNMSIHVEGDRLHVYTAYRRPKKRLFIDTYHLPGRRYLHSIEIFNAPYGAYRVEDRVYVLDDTLITVLRLERR